MLVVNIGVIFVFHLILHPTLSEFDCVEVTNQTTSCPNELQCLYDDVYEATSSMYCRCKIVITGLPFSGNVLDRDTFAQICIKYEDRLQELWINGMELEHLDNEIFDKYKNLTNINLSDNNLRLNFSKQAERLKVLNLTHNNLIVLDSAALVNLTSLKVLDLSFNRLDKVNLSAYEGNIEEIYLNNNELISIDTTHSLTWNLKILNLANNLLTNLRLSLYSLQELYLENNKILKLDIFLELRGGFQVLNLGNNFLDGGLYVNGKFVETEGVVDVVRDFKTLTNVDLSNNKLNNIPPNTFRANNSLNVLNLSSNNITMIHESNFQNMKGVNILNLSNNSLSEKIINCTNLQNLKNVSDLDLSHNLISQILKCTLNRLKKLEKLNLLGNRVENIPPSTFGELDKLQDLNLAENKIKEIPVGLFDDLTELKRLNLSNNRIKHFDINSLTHNTKLREFDISSNDLQDLDLELLKKKLPELKILDFDRRLVKCELYSDVFQYFEENSVVLKSCADEKCCTGSKLFIIFIIVVLVLVLCVIILSCILCKRRNFGEFILEML